MTTLDLPSWPGSPIFTILSEGKVRALWWAGWWYPKRYVHILISRAYRYDLIWQKMWLNYRFWRDAYPGLCEWALNTNTSVLVRDGGRLDADREKEEVMWPQGQRMEWCSHKPRNANSYQKLEEARSALSPGVDFLLGAHSADTLILDSGLQNSESIHFYCFESPYLG